MKIYTGLYLIIALGIFILYLWFRTVNVMKPIMSIVAKENKFIKEENIIAGLRYLILSIGIALILIMWQAYLYYFYQKTPITESVTVILFGLFAVLSFKTRESFTFAFKVANYVNKHQKSQRSK